MKKISNIFTVTIVGIILMFVLLPFVNVILQSLMTTDQSRTSDLIPNPLSIESYISLKDADLILPFVRTIVISLVGTFINVLLIFLVSFAISRKNFKYKKLVIFLLFLQIVVPHSSLIVSRFVLIKDMGLLNTYTSLIVSQLVAANSIFILSSYMEKIPNSLIEMIYMNGGGLVRSLKDVVFHQVKPGLVIISLLTFIGYYNIYMEALLFINDPEKKTLQIALREFLGLGENSSGNIATKNVQMASIMFTISIILIIVPLLNKYYIKNITDGGLK